MTLRHLPFLALLILSGCMSAPIQGVPGPVHHVAVCWLREPGDIGDRKKLIKTSQQLRDIPGVRTVHAGGVVRGNRSIVDSSFDVAIVMTFDNVPALRAYLATPTHEEAVRKVIQPLVQRTLVYDFIDGRAVY
jgi:hypothetical protein